MLHRSSFKSCSFYNTSLLPLLFSGEVLSALPLAALCWSAGRQKTGRLSARSWVTRAPLPIRNGEDKAKRVRLKEPLCSAFLLWFSWVLSHRTERSCSSLFKYACWDLVSKILQHLFPGSKPKLACPGWVSAENWDIWKCAKAIWTLRMEISNLKSTPSNNSKEGTKPFPYLYVFLTCLIFHQLLVLSLTFIFLFCILYFSCTFVFCSGCLLLQFYFKHFFFFFTLVLLLMFSMWVTSMFSLFYAISIF